ncbi:FAD-dependent oxidoreductase [Bacillus pacificus]
MKRIKNSFNQQEIKKFVSFKGGLSTIIDRLEKVLTETVIKKGAVTTAVSKQGNRYEVSFANHESIQADYVVLATPHDIAESLLQSNELNEQFHTFKNSSLISIYLGFDILDEQLPADGTGFIVTENSDLHCDACTWTSRKWKHTSGNQKLLVRMFYKSTNPVYETIKNYNEEELVRVALYDIEKESRN